MTWNDHVMAGEAFAAENFLIGAGGLYPHIQLFNPAESGKRVRLRSVHAILGAVVNVNVARHDTPLATLGLPEGFVVENLLSSEGPGVAEMRSSQVAPLVGSPFWLLQAQSLTPAVYPPEGREWGMDLLEGHGILMRGGAGTTLIVNWQWVEVPL